MSGELELGKLRLTVAKSNFQLSSTTTAILSHLDDQNELVNSSRSPRLDLDTIKHVWVRRGRGMRLMLTLQVDGKPLNASDLRSLSELLHKAQIWPQLGLKASLVELNQDSTTNASSDMIILSLTHAVSTRESPKDSVYRLCYTIPAADVAPPANIDVLGLNVVNLDLQVTKKIRERRPKKRKDAHQDDCGKEEAKAELRHMDLDFEPLLHSAEQDHHMSQWTQPDSSSSSFFSTLSSNSDEEILLLGTHSVKDDEDDILKFPSYLPTSNVVSQVRSHEQSCSEMSAQDSSSRKRPAGPHDEPEQPEPEEIRFDCITSLVDAVLRLSIEENPWRLGRAIRVKRVGNRRTLGGISPTLWTPGYSKEIATRAPLLPTVAHALSHSIYPNAKSHTLKAKLQKLLLYDSEDANSEIKSNLSTLKETIVPPNSRFELMSAMIWKVMQKQLYQPDAARRLRRLTFNTSASAEDDEEDEQLFSQSTEETGDRNFDDFMIDDDEEDIMEYEGFEHMDDDDEFLFNDVSFEGEIRDEEKYEDLSQGRVRTIELDEDDLLLQDLES